LLSLVCAADRRYLLSFPTRRSSDLLSTVPGLAATWGKGITVDAGRWIAYWARASIEGTPGSLPWTEVGNRELEVVVSKPRVYGSVDTAPKPMMIGVSSMTAPTSAQAPTPPGPVAPAPVIPAAPAANTTEAPAAPAATAESAPDAPQERRGRGRGRP